MGKRSVPTEFENEMITAPIEIDLAPVEVDKRRWVPFYVDDFTFHPHNWMGLINKRNALAASLNRRE